MNADELREKLNQLVDAGDEGALQQFVVEHLKEFPEGVRGQMLFGLYTDALEQQTDEAEMIELQKRGAAALKEIALIKESLNSRSEIDN